MQKKNIRYVGSCRRGTLSEGKLPTTARQMEVVIIGKAWLGLDAGKESHWAHMLDAFGAELLSRKVENDEADLSKLINDALLLAGEVVWAVEHNPEAVQRSC